MSQNEKLLGIPEEVKPLVISAVKDKIRDYIVSAVKLGKYIGDTEVVSEIYEEIRLSSEELSDLFMSSDVREELESAVDIINRNTGPSQKSSTLERPNCSINLVTGTEVETGVTRRKVPSESKSKGLKRKTSKNNKRSTSKYRGVSLNRTSGKWRSRVFYRGRDLMIGTFDNEIDAARAYDKMKIRSGDLSKLNFPGDIQ